MRAWVWAIALVMICAGPASAGIADWSFTGVAENDVFDYSPDHTDRYYTHGTQIAATSPGIDYQHLPSFARWTCFLEDPERSCRKDRTAHEDYVVRWGLEAGQNIYTPTSRAVIPDSRDRPYAGWAYVGASAGTYSRAESNTLEVQLGVVGPSSGAAWVQDNFHDLIHALRFLGWKYQLRDEVAFVVLGEHRWAPQPLWQADPGNRSGWSLESPSHIDFALGTVQDSLDAGRSLRFGYGLDADDGPPRIRPAPSGSVFIAPKTDWSAYGFIGLDGRAVARNIFLDGNTFLASPHVKRRWLVWEATSGAAVRWKGLRVGYTYVWQSEEFLGQRGPQRFGSWSVTVLPRVFSR